MFFTKPDLDFSSGYVEPKPVDPNDTASIMDVGRAAYDSAKKTNEIMSGHLNLRSVYDDHNAKVKALTGADLANPENGDIGVYDFDTRRKIEMDWQQYQSDGGTLSRNWFLRQWRENDYKRQLGELAEKHPDKRNEILPKTSFQSQAFDVARRAEETELATWEKSKKGAAGWAAWLGGNLAAAATDPVNMITAPIGFGAGTGIKGLLAAALKAGAVNASVEAGVQPFVQDYRNQVGLTSGIGPAALAIGSAAGFGAGLDLGVRGTFRGVAHGFGYEPVVKDGIVVSWRKKPIDAQPSPEIKAKPQLHEIPHETMIKAADGDMAALRKVYESDANTDPVVRQMLDAMDAEERLAAKPLETIDDATHAATLTQAARAIADPDSEPMPVRVDATPPVEGVSAKIEAELSSMKAKAAAEPDNAELATRIADAEAQIRAIDGFGSDPVRDAALLRDGAPITTDMNLTHPGVQQARALAALSDEAFAMVRDGSATPEIGAMVANFVGDRRHHSAILSDVVKMRPVSDREARAVIAELVRSPEYTPSTPVDMRRLDDPYGAAAKAQVAQLEREMQEELAAAGRATPEEIIATPEGQAAAIARANDVRAAIAELTGIAPPEIQVRVFSRIDDLPSNLSAKVRVANAQAFSGSMKAFQAARSLDERLAAKLSLDAAARGEGIEGIADDAAIWIAAYAMDPNGRMAHEVVHALRTTGRVSPEEIRSLAVASREAGVWNKAREEVYRAEYSRRSGDVEALLEEEAAAHFVEAVVRGDVVRPVNAPEVMSVVERIRRFFAKLKAALTGRGFRDATVEKRDSALDVVDALLAGDIARREQHAEWMRHSGEAMYAKKDAEIGRSMRADLDQHGYFSLTDNAKLSVIDDGQPLFAINAYHGSASKFDEVDLDFVNAGAKSQKYGWGFYASSRQRVGTNWAHTVARNTGGRPYLYTVTLDAEPYQLMRWESKMSAQPEQVRRAVEAVSAEHKLTIDADSTGEAIYRALSKKLGERGASSALYDAGIRGNVQSNTTARNGTFDNYVMFDEADVRVETREPAPKPQLQSIADDVRETFSGLVEQMQGSAAEMARDPQFVAAITDRVSGLVGRYGTSAPDAEMVSAIVNRIAGGVTDGNGVIEAVTRELQAGLPSGNGPMFALRQTPDVDRVSALKRALEREIDAAQRGRAGSDAGAGKFIDAQGREGNRRTSEDFGAGSTAGDAARSVLKDRASRAAALEAFIAPELRAEAVNARAVSQGFTTVGYHGTYAAEIDVVNPFVTGRDFGFHFGTNPKAANSRLGVPSTLAEHLDSVLSRIFGGTSGARKPEDGSILPVRVRVTRPLRLPDVGVTGGGRWSDPVAMKKLLDHSESTAPGELRAWVSEWVRDNGADNQARRKTIADNHIFSKALAAELDRLGYDAIVYRNTVEGYGHDSMFVWHPEQVRSLFDFFHERADGPGLMASNDAVEADLVSRLEKLVEKNGIENQPLMFAMRDAKGRMKSGAQERVKSLADDLAQIEYDIKTGSIDDRAALQQKRASLLNAKAEDAGLDDMNNHRNARGEKDAVIGYLRMVETYGKGGFKGDDVWTLKSTIANEALRRMAEFVWTARKGAILGDMRRTVNKSVSARIENVIREAAGEQTSDAMAKRMAKAWLDTAEWLRQQFNAYGGDIGKLTGWFAPQYHDAQALLSAGRSAWVKYLMADGVLDRDRMLDRAGNRLSDSALAELLTDIWRTITTGGASDREVTGRSGGGALYKRHSEHRVLHFKGADAYLKYARDFGGGDVYAMMIGHVQTMARDIAALRRFGANPETVRGRLAEHLRQEALMQRSGRSVYDDLADAVADLKIQADVIKGPVDDAMRKIADIHTELDGIANKKRHAARRDALHKSLGDAHAQMRDAIGKGPMTAEKMEIVQRIISLTDEMSEIAEQYPVMSRDPVTRVERVITRADEMWKTYTGHTNTPVDGVIAGYMTAARNIVSSSTLAFAPISAITDQATGLAARAFVGMPVTQQLQSFLKSFSPANRREALELGFGLDQAAAAFAVQSRFAGWVDTRSISGYIADRGHAFSGLSPMTQASKIGFSSDFVRWMARLAKDHSFESLEPWTRDMLLRHGFTADDWSRLRTVSPEISRGVEVMSYQAIARQAGEELAEKYQRVHLRERAMAVLEPTLQGRTAFISETRPGTVIGEIMRSGAMLKSFPTSYMMLILGRFYDELQAGNMGRHNTIVAAASIFVVGTLLGALVRQAKSITQGRDAEDMTNPDFWAKSFMQSGGAGIFGDFMASAVSRTGGGFERTLAGPMPDRVANLFNLTVGNAVQYARDEKTNAGREAVKFAKQNTPLIPWYLRSAYEHMILDQIQSKVDPDVYRARQSRMQLFKKLNGTDFYWPPGAVVPTRSPNISRAFGAGK